MGVSLKTEKRRSRETRMTGATNNPFQKAKCYVESTL